MVEVEVGEYEPFDVVEFSDVRLEIVDGAVNIIGYMENVDSESQWFNLWVGAYDEQGNLLGVGKKAVRNLDVGERREFVIWSIAGDILSADSFRACIFGFISEEFR